MEEEAVNPEVTAASEELQRMVVNASLMQVLNNINTSLKRIEEHLVPKDKKAKPNDDDSREAVETLNHSEPKPETLYYNVTHEDAKRIIKGFNPMTIICIPIDKNARVVDVLKDPVSDHSWKFYKPSWVESNGTRYTTAAQGKPNFLPLWEIRVFGAPKALFNTKKIWYIPYSKIPGYEVGSRELRRRPFDESEKLELCDTLNTLWKLPSDYRLDFDFQNHRLRTVGRTVEPLSVPNSLPRARQLRIYLDGLMSAAGSFDIYDQASDCILVGYNLTSKISIEDTEEWLSNFPLTAMEMDKDGFPDSITRPVAVVDPRHPAWRRWIFIEGLAEIECHPLWHIPGSPNEYNSSRRGILELLFNLHKSCASNASESLARVKPSPMVFHFCAKGFCGETDLRRESHHYHWRCRKMRGTNLVISTIAYTIQMFPSRLGAEYWTLLFLLPIQIKRGRGDLPGAKPFKPSMFNGKCFMMAMLIAISMSLEWSSHSWIEIVEQFERKLNPVDPEKLPLDDEDYSQSHTCFWIIGSVEEFEAIILDAIEQWVCFKAKYKLDDEMQNFLMEQLEMPDADSERLEEATYADQAEFRRKQMLDKIAEIESHKKRLEDSLRRLRALRERAKIVRDGLFSLASVMEAKQSRLLGENVKLLTYATIFYLPPAFSSSLWGINNMFGTGTLGFAVIITVISLLTYGIVFGLLHLRFLHELVVALKRRGHTLKRAFIRRYLR